MFVNDRCGRWSADAAISLTPWIHSLIKVWKIIESKSRRATKSIIDGHVVATLEEIL